MVPNFLVCHFGGCTDPDIVQKGRSGFRFKLTFKSPSHNSADHSTPSFTMGPPRRNRSNSNVSNRHVNGQHPHTRQPQQAPTPSLPVQPEPHTGMTPASRYNHNLKVLRRRDPSIVSIFDQFSHVCVYHHNGKKWEKHGFEGSMFLYERYVDHHRLLFSYLEVVPTSSMAYSVFYILNPNLILHIVAANPIPLMDSIS